MKIGSQLRQFPVQVPVEPGHVPAVRQSVVDEQGHRQRYSAVFLGEFSPGEPGIAVVPADAGVLDLGVGQPGQAGDEEVVQGIAGLLQFVLFQGRLLLPLPLLEKVLIGQRAAVHQAVDVHAVGPHGGVGGLAAVILDDLAVL